ncbi:hypothetical protein KSP40_PGU020925 [Platanthera guangdongensis]|uniref:Ycf15 n=1 Tax=Platanthera guangdongensis TaxID=2320717 RepID=A0ABR2LUC4_9ASPA
MPRPGTPIALYLRNPSPTGSPRRRNLLPRTSKVLYLRTPLSAGNPNPPESRLPYFKSQHDSHVSIGMRAPSSITRL